MIKIALVGDIAITRLIPENGYEGSDELIELISGHEVKFANLEATVHMKEGYPSAFPGGTWIMANPNCLDSLIKFGFNVFNTANNHSMDYSHKGLLATHKYLQERKLCFCGTGDNLAQATASTFIECSYGRVAVMGTTSSFHDSDAAGHQSNDMPGRPGVNPLRHKSIYEVNEENYYRMISIANDIQINEYHNQAIKEGFLLPKDNFSFGSYEFIKGNSNRLHTYPLEKDLLRITNSITEAKKQSDCVIVSIHSHQFCDGDKRNPAEFIQRFAKKCIEAGATIIVGHGPHILRGIELYNGGIIFYSLGNFIFQNETVSNLPADFYEKYTVPSDSGVATAMDIRSKNGTIGLNIDPEVWNSVIVSIEFENSLTNIKLYPIDLGYEMSRYRKGWPKLTNNIKILEKIRDLSRVFGTQITINKGVGNIILT